MLTTDLEAIKRIHEQHFWNEFEFPDFSKFVSLFVIEDSDARIVSAGGIRTIVESVIITDRSYDTIGRVKALHKVLDISEYLTRAAGFDSLHCFVSEENWYRQLENKGFVPTKGRSLVLTL